MRQSNVAGQMRVRQCIAQFAGLDTDAALGDQMGNQAVWVGISHLMAP